MKCYGRFLHTENAKERWLALALMKVCMLHFACYHVLAYKYVLFSLLSKDLQLGACLFCLIHTKRVRHTFAETVHARSLGIYFFSAFPPTGTFQLYLYVNTGVTLIASPYLPFLTSTNLKFWSTFPRELKSSLGKSIKKPFLFSWSDWF